MTDGQWRVVPTSTFVNSMQRQRTYFNMKPLNVLINPTRLLVSWARRYTSTGRAVRCFTFFSNSCNKRGVRFFFVFKSKPSCIVSEFTFGSKSPSKSKRCVTAIVEGCAESLFSAFVLTFIFLSYLLHASSFGSTPPCPRAGNINCLRRKGHSSRSNSKQIQS